MELAAAAAKVLSCPLVLLCLLSVCLCSGRQEAASLCNSIKVYKSEAGQWRNEVQGLLNRQTFFLYKDNKCHASGTHEISMNATKMCDKQVDTLKDGADIFKGMLLQMWEEIHTIRKSLILQAEMCCQYEGEKRFRGSWVFRLNGKNMFHVDTSTGNWTELDRRFKTMMEMWKKDRDIAAFLDKTSQGDCRTWLDELKSHWKEYLEPTGRDSLSCDLIVKSATKPGEPWHKGSCSVNGKTLFQFDKNQVTPFSKLTVEENATEVYADFPKSVENNLEVMRYQLCNMEPERFKTMGNHNHALQVAMKTQYNQGQLTDAFCNFTIDGQSSFSFNPIKNTWTGSGPDASSIMKQWEGNGELGQGLEKLLKGDFTHCYKKLLTLWRETPRSTIKAWAVTQLTFATQTTVNSTYPTSGAQSRNMTWVVILCIAGISSSLIT